MTEFGSKTFAEVQVANSPIPEASTSAAIGAALALVFALGRRRLFPAAGEGRGD